MTCPWSSPAYSTTKTGRHNITESCVKHQNSNSLKFAQPSGFVTLNLKICFSLCVPIGLFFNSQPLTWFKTFLRSSGFVSLWYYVYDSNMFQVVFNHKQVWELKKTGLIFSYNIHHLKFVIYQQFIIHFLSLRIHILTIMMKIKCHQ